MLFSPIELKLFSSIVPSLAMFVTCVNFLSVKDTHGQWARCHADAFAFYNIWIYVTVSYVKPV